jgi:hypothetical protein
LPGTASQSDISIHKEIYKMATIPMTKGPPVTVPHVTAIIRPGTNPKMPTGKRTGNVRLVPAPKPK